MSDASTASAPPRRQLPPTAVQGGRDALPVLLAYVPFALALGAAMARTSVHPLTAWSSSSLVFAGAAQLVTVQMLGSGAAAVLVIATGVIVNARHLLYSAAIAGHARDWPARWRLGGAYLLADPVFAMSASRFEQDAGSRSGRERFHYLLGVGIVFWAAWQVLVGIGMILGAALPTTLPLGLVTSLTFLLLLLPALKTAPSCAAAAAGGVVALLLVGLPLGLNLAAGAVAGIAAGVAVDGRRG